jgi:hypothetical protein
MGAMDILRRYWIQFDLPPMERTRGGWLTIDDTAEAYMRGGCGVTGYDLDDCLRLIQEVVFRGDALPAVASVIEDVDVSSLDFDRLRGNFGVPVWRGIWYPNFQRSAPGR